MEDAASFLSTLKKFHHNKGTPFNQLIKLNGKDVNLLMLYQFVTNFGGWRAVDHQDIWKIISELLKWGPPCLNDEVAIKHIYLRYLADYEDQFYKPRRHYFAFYDKRELKIEVPMKYNNVIVSDNLRDIYGLSKDILSPSPYEKLCLSLISPLPNEQDFAINVLTCISIEINRFLIKDDPRILKYLFAHAGIYNDDSLETLFDKYYRVDRLHCLKSFWEDNFDYDKIDPKYINDLISYFGPIYQNKFSTDEYVLSRVEQVGKIILNLSASKNNQGYMLLNECCIRFIIYCFHSKSEILVSISWELLAIISSNIRPNIPDFHFIILHCITTIQKNIPCRISDALEILINFSKDDVYLETIIFFITSDVLSTLLKLLTINDLIIVMKILDFLLILSLNVNFCKILFENKSIEYLFVVLQAEVDQLKSCWGVLKYSDSQINNNVYNSIKTVFNTKTTKEHLNRCALIPNEEINDIFINNDNIDLEETKHNIKSGIYLCEWRSCIKQFKSQESLRAHCQDHSKSTKCLWWGCDKINTYGESLQLHLINDHCTNNHWNDVKSCIDHYNEYANFYNSNKNQKIKAQNPATKSIRLTAALILKNLLNSYPLAANQVKHYEFSLLEIASSNHESSKIVAEILGLISST